MGRYHVNIFPVWRVPMWKRRLVGQRNESQNPVFGTPNHSVSVATQMDPADQPQFCNAASPEESVKLDDADVTWDVLATHLEVFLQCWESGSQPPSLADHLPPGTSPVRRMVLAELVKIDLEYRQQKDVDVYRLEDYLAKYPETGRAGRRAGGPDLRGVPRAQVRWRGR